MRDDSQEFFGGDGAKKAWKDIWGCGQGIGAVPVNAHGKPLRPAIIWLDRRAEAETGKEVDGPLSPRIAQPGF